MKKIYLLLLLFTTLMGTAQTTFIKISENYYRSTPFKREFSQFLNHLINDPTLTNKKIVKRTDSTLFFLQGTYTSHNPFFFKAIRTEVILAEKEEVITVDSIKTLQTLYIYQILGYAPPGVEGNKEVKEEYSKFCKRYKKGFTGNHYTELKREAQQSGEMQDYSFDNLNFYPLTVAWATSASHNDNIFALTIRFKVIDNIPYLIETADSF